jgi:hypothetical protein
MSDIFARIDRLETVVFGRTSTSTGKLPDRKLPTREVALRAGRSVRSIERDLEAKTHPPPDEIVNGRKYWWLSTLERHDRERERSTTHTVGKRRSRPGS